MNFKVFFFYFCEECGRDFYWDFIESVGGGNPPVQRLDTVQKGLLGVAGGTGPGRSLEVAYGTI